MDTTDIASRPVKRGRPGYDQETVLRIAVEAFNEYGYDATSMGKLADRLGISKSAIYHHVPSKEDLLRLALDEALFPLEAVISEVRTHAGSADERLEFFLRSTIRILIDKRPYVTLLLRLRGNTELERDALQRRRAMDRQLAELVTAAQSDGKLRDDLEPRSTARLLFGMINSVVDWYRVDGPIEASSLENQAVSLLFDGLHTVAK
ncbi:MULTISPECIES: TetR/AcrR family transcriptional regulator [Micrococcaceae]|uniref:TetR/AcrR family transcriptional regulator n=1 Tax=Glutamicibacter ectropisis TaxID=3046593 RepID=A0AAU6WB60_9MICC|nr:TetR/AcrR family transcriptional regulator [Arthrobacter sp. NIO-1057]KSU67317.1 TetR family transcriptional regulator [Arthrobacter sp. NIO-1057]SCC04011.1 transcriptional regulator, TetR family [Arthrobacter sp. NIO-1057]